MMRNLIHLQKSLLMNMQRAVPVSKAITALSFLLHLVIVHNGSQPQQAENREMKQEEGSPVDVLFSI